MSKLKERLFLDESRLNGRKIYPNKALPLLEVDKGLTRLEAAKRDPNIPIYLVGVLSSGDKVNRNGRLYPWSILKKECERYFEELVKVGLSHGECFAEGHKILTRDFGWVDFKNLKGDEYVATMNQVTKEFEWQLPIRKVEYDYEGEMVRLKSKKINTLVTPNHKFLVQTYGTSNKTKIVTANELTKSQAIPKLSVWKGISPEKIVIENAHGKLEFPTAAFAKFAGWYIAEGWFRWDEANGGYSVSISQSKQNVIKEIEQCLVSLDLAFSTSIKDDKKSTEYTFTISNKCLAYYFKQFGKSYNKYIPTEIKNLASADIECFIEAYTKGDGWGRLQKENESVLPHRLCATVSERLAEDLLEVFQKTGTSGKITQKEQFASYYTIENLLTGETKEILDIVFYTNKEYTDNKDQFVVKQKRKESRGTVLYFISRLRKKTIEIKGALKPNELYKGKVYCVEVPNSIIYVMNKGIPFWSHNCDHPENSATPMLKNASHIIEDIWFKGKDVYGKIKLYNAYMPQSAPGLMVRGIILNSGTVGISSRALGSLDESVSYDCDVVAEDLEIACWDIVSFASNHGSEKWDMVNESKKRQPQKALLTESQCFGNMCGIKNPLESTKHNSLLLTEAEKSYVNILGAEKFLQLYYQNNK